MFDAFSRMYGTTCPTQLGGPSVAQVKPTAITLGCMVDALVCNQQPEEASALVKEIRADDACRDVLNTVTFTPGTSFGKH